MPRDNRAEAIYRVVGEQVADRRISLGLTQEQLANMTDGRLSRSAIANIERGRQRVAVHHLLDLAEALGVKPEVLLPPADTIPPIPGMGANHLRARLERRGGTRLLEQKGRDS